MKIFLGLFGIILIVAGILWFLVGGFVMGIIAAVDLFMNFSDLSFWELFWDVLLIFARRGIAFIGGAILVVIGVALLRATD